MALKPVNSTKTWNINHSPIHLAKTWLKVDVAQSCLTVCNPMHYIARGILQARNTGVGSLSLLHGISTTQGLNPGLLHCRWILYLLSHKGSKDMGDRHRFIAHEKVSSQ